MRGYGLSQYEVWPKAPGPVHVPVVFSEPYEVAAKAHGFDMFTEPVRRAALSAARDTGMPALTGRLTLVYDQPDAGNVGFLVYVPVYRIGAAHGTVERRRRAIDGYAFGAFRLREALQPLLAEFPEILDVAVYDGAQPADADLMFDTRLRPFGGPDVTEPAYSTDLPVELAGQIWTLRFRSRPAFEQQVASSLPVVVLASGAAVTLLLAWLAFAIGRTRDQALAIAAGMTAELRATTAELQAIYDSSPLGVYRTDADGLVVSINRRGEEICGLPAQRLLGATWVERHPCCGSGRRRGGVGAGGRRRRPLRERAALAARRRPLGLAEREIGAAVPPRQARWARRHHRGRHRPARGRGRARAQPRLPHRSSSMRRPTPSS